MGIAMIVKLRGHHLLCMLGYRGMGYSAEFSANMTQVYNQLREKPDTTIALIVGADDLCACYPTNAVSHCHNQSVMERDAAVLERLGLQTGDVLQWQVILHKVRANIAPEHLEELCHTCHWRAFGVCETGVRTIQEGNDLPPLP
jgi:hypothetical protein